jgi:hypothetical protein
MQAGSNLSVSRHPVFKLSLFQLSSSFFAQVVHRASAHNSETPAVNFWPSSAATSCVQQAPKPTHSNPARAPGVIRCPGYNKQQVLNHTPPAHFVQLGVIRCPGYNEQQAQPHPTLQHRDLTVTITLGLRSLITDVQVQEHYPVIRELSFCKLAPPVPVNSSTTQELNFSANISGRHALLIPSPMHATWPSIHAPSVHRVFTFM